MSPTPALAALTSHLPWFVKDPAINLVGKECYHSLIERLDFSDTQCLKIALSKGLGFGIVMGGSIVKVPQIITILSARSVEGLPLSSAVPETLAYAITVVYSYRNSFPFSTWGENFFLTLQNIVIVLLIVQYLPVPKGAAPKRPNNTLGFIFAALATIGTLVLLVLLPPGPLAQAQALTLPLSLVARFPQILNNYRARSTGQLSALTLFAQVLGCFARLFTTATEVADARIFAGIVLALVLNLVLAAQMVLYWGSSVRVPKDAPVKEKLAEREFGWASGAQTHVEPVPAAVQSAPVSAPSGRRWARKVD